MTVQELIDELNKVEDKSKIVAVHLDSEWSVFSINDIKIDDNYVRLNY